MKAFLGGGIICALFSCTMVFADPATMVHNPNTLLRLSVGSFEKTYAVFIVTNPHSNCPFLRYRVVADGISVLSKALRPGQSQMVQLGRGLSPGAYDLQIQSVGCRAVLAQKRLVVMRKASPDHGWRAG